MLCVVFHLGENRYAIAARDVVEVLPYTPLEVWPRMPACVAGMLVYRGQPTAIVDLMRLAQGVPCQLLWSTRMLMVCRPGNNAEGSPQANEHLGLLVNRVATCQLPDATGPTAASQLADWGWLEHDERGLFQRINLGRLIPAALGTAEGIVPDADRSPPR